MKMTKEDNKNIIRVVCDGILRDAVATYPALEAGISRDILSIKSLYRTRGCGFLTHDLPSLDQVLLQGLETGHVLCSGPLAKAKGRYTKVPKLFSDLWLRVFGVDGIILSEPDPTAIFFLRSLFNVGKKFTGTHSEKSEELAKREYTQIEDQMRAPSFCWGPRFDYELEEESVHLCDGINRSLFGEDCPSESFRPGGLFNTLLDEPRYLGMVESELFDLLCTIQDVCDHFCEEASRYDNYSFIKSNNGCEMKHGPGSVSDMYQSKDKYMLDNVWTAQLDRWFPFEEFVGTLYRFGTLQDFAVSKLICVPKDARGPRLIASEPAAYQYCQQGMLSKLTTIINNSSLSRHINLQDQFLSQRGAKQGSTNRLSATVDLSSASDRLSCWLVERVFRKAPILLSQLNACRTTTISVDGKLLHLKKFASQGSATNFPIQTIVYALICKGVILHNRTHELGSARIKNDLILSRSRNEPMFRCYGDDLIVPVEDLEKLKIVLSYVGLKVNHKKTFSSGFFRESCGGDFYKGYDVTPVKITHLNSATPTSRHRLVSTSNLFFTKGLWITSQVVLELYGNKKLLPILSPDVGYFGWTSFLGSYYSHLKTKWDNNLHRLMYRTILPKGKVRRSTQSTIGALRERLITVPGINAQCIDDHDGTKISDNLRWVALPAVQAGRVNNRCESTEI